MWKLYYTFADVDSCNVPDTENDLLETWEVPNDIPEYDFEEYEDSL